MKLYGLIGFPLSHSFSKKFFTEKFEKEGIKNCRYENFPLPVIDDLKKIISLPALQGFNITIPYKEQIIPFLHEVSDIVNKINACNCVKIVNGKLIGFNTDVPGFQYSLVTGLNPLLHKKALVLGTGGSSKAVKYVLQKMGIEFLIISRKPAAGGLSYEQITEEIIHNHKLIINTTPLGMFPNVVEAPPLPYQFITKDHFLFDLIYNPEKTLFLKKGEQQGAQIQNGYEMLILQAEESWRIWNNND
jgi:shikimate dehydrogenase